MPRPLQLLHRPLRQLRRAQHPARPLKQQLVSIVNELGVVVLRDDELVCVVARFFVVAAEGCVVASQDRLTKITNLLHFERWAFWV